MMMMYFHGGYNEVILFDFWRISSLAGLLVSMLGLFILGILYEGLKFFREFLLQIELKRLNRANRAVSPSSSSATMEEGAESLSSTEPVIRAAGGGPEPRAARVVQTRLLSLAHLTQTGLQLLQVILSYCLMLVFMTYNVWLCLAVALGATVG